MKHIFTTLLLLNVILSFAQQGTGSIRGRVTAHGDSMELAAVALLKTQLITTSNKNGFYEIKNVPEGTYQLRISYIGYENVQDEVIVKKGEPVEFNAELIPLNSRIKEIVVTGNMREVKKLESVTPIDVYDTKYFKRDVSNNVWEALQHVNGIFPDIDNGVSNTTDIQINGIEGNFTMILIDGVPAMNGLAGIYALNALPMSMIDKIEVVKGAASSLYGSEAVAGVINIITKNPTTAPVFSANVYFTSMLETNAEFTAAFKMKKVSSLLALSAENMNYRWDINNDGFTDIPLTNRINFYNKWSIARPDNRVATIYARYLFEDRFGGQASLRSADRGSDLLYGEAVRTPQWQAGFQYQLPVKEKILLMADYSEHYQNAYFGTSHFIGQQRSLFSQLSFTKKVDRYNDLLMGITYRFNYYSDNTSLSDALNSGLAKLYHIAGAFIEDEISITPQHKLLLGVRCDYSTRSGPVFTPRINYKWNSVNEKNVVRIGLGTGYRVPNLLNEGFGALNGSRRVQIDEPLKPETSLNATLNYTRVQELPGGVLSLDATAFYTFFMNYVEPDYSVDSVISYANVKNGFMAPGFSLNAEFTFSYPLKVGVGFTYVKAFEIEHDETSTQVNEAYHVSPFTANFYLSYNFAAPQLSIDWTGNFVSPMRLVTVNNDYRAPSSPFYTIQNVQVTKRFKNGIDIYFGIKNLFNFIQKDPILRPNDPFNRDLATNNPNGYRFDTQYGFTSTQGIQGFLGFRYRFK